MYFEMTLACGSQRAWIGTLIGTWRAAELTPLSFVTTNAAVFRNPMRSPGPPRGWPGSTIPDDSAPTCAADQLLEIALL
jgi:hypothetical protein